MKISGKRKYPRKLSRIIKRAENQRHYTRN
nr:MAG TPA: hypothetical protein [Caudoviricetes sp.]